ncbi:hypothetical protein EDC01DRAFT_644076 [Geopyxis carbonaria]|nr:hypothetical protein EDC01DRAFT_644076 [Geopyxis carbonaria]
MHDTHVTTLFINTLRSPHRSSSRILYSIIHTSLLLLGSIVYFQHIFIPTTYFLSTGSMRFFPLVLASTLLLSASASPVPAPEPSLWDDIKNTINPETDVDVTDAVLLLDAPAFQSPSDSNVWLASMRAFVYLRQPDLGAVTDAFEKFLTETLGITAVGTKLSTLEERIRLFAAIPNPGEKVDITLSSGGCSVMTLELPETPLSGTVETDAVSLGSGCSALAQAAVTVGTLDDRDFNATIYPSVPTGWGVISDIDDTIKVSHVLDKLVSAKKAFLEPVEAVAGMPELYQKLKGDLTDSQFIYLSGSPFQFYPMLHSLVNDLMKVPGPLILQNFTFTDPAAILDLVGGATKEYKLANIDRIKGWYPGKKFLAVGDSGQSDPEVYGEAVRKHGKEWMGCIWIREVTDAGANNTEARFASAFEGVEDGRWRLFKDPTELMTIDVAGGEC